MVKIMEIKGESRGRGTWKRRSCDLSPQKLRNSAHSSLSAAGPLSSGSQAAGGRSIKPKVVPQLVRSGTGASRAQV